MSLTTILGSAAILVGLSSLVFWALFSPIERAERAKRLATEFLKKDANSA